MRNFKTGFTMIELIFVIVVLGILAAVAVPKFAATRVDAQISKGIADVASIRSGIVSERQSRLIIGSTGYIPNGIGTYTYQGRTFKQLDNGGLFGGVLMYGVANDSNKDGAWSAIAGSGTYVYRAGGISTTFTYTPADGKFDCTKDSGYCNELTNK
ncbi:MAG: prepilin-type N-terminal cleavage/methylation domain-containing protein [Sulfurimonadaceae bacterium]|jgi:general secretion pathway protein G|nr:prepilin-type N-terminal cleavage/methylation domain-containing protein [Sulfurimonadaceae bacterium]